MNWSTPSLAARAVLTEWVTKGRTPCSASVEDSKRGEIAEWLLRKAHTSDIRQLLERMRDDNFTSDLRDRLNAIRERKAA